MILGNTLIVNVKFIINKVKVKRLKAELTKSVFILKLELHVETNVCGITQYNYNRAM